MQPGGGSTGTGGNPEIVQQKTDEALRAQPSVSGGDAGLRLDQKTAKLFADADAGAKKAGDSYVTVERLLIALAGLSGSKAAAAIAEGNRRINAKNSGIQRLSIGI